MAFPQHPLEHFRWFDTLIVDLNRILIQPSQTFEDDEGLKEVQYEVLTSQAWSKFEAGQISEKICWTQIGELMPTVDTTTLNNVLAACLEWTVISEMVAFMKNLKCQSTISLIAMSNLPSPARVEPYMESPSYFNFDDMFTSNAEGVRLPYPSIFTKAVASPACKDASRTLFVTISIDAQVTAKAKGLHTLLLDADEPQTHMKRISALTRDPLPRARAWLKDHAGTMNLTTSVSSIEIKDTYIQHLILEATGDASLIYPELTEPASQQTTYTWVDGHLPSGIWLESHSDLDSNALPYLTLPRLTSPAGAHKAHAMLDEMLRHKIEDDKSGNGGLLNGYLTSKKTRLDPVMLANAIALFYAHGRGADVCATKNSLFDVLKTGAYEDGTHYYPSPDFFLFAVSRLLVLSRLPMTDDHCDTDREMPDQERQKDEALACLSGRFLPVLKERVLARTAADGDALALACRLIAAARCGIRLDDCLQKLLEMQEDDGSWPQGVIYRFTRRKGLCWHRGLTVAMVVRAIEVWEGLRSS